MKNLNFLMFSLVLLMFALVSCDTDDLKDDIGTLKNRVQNLEASVQNLNENVKAIQLILENSKTIQDYTERDGVYTLKFSDGSIITLTQGVVGNVVMPKISIDADGYWVINGEKQSIKATGNDGQTPEFQISVDGYWQVRIGDDKFVDVKDENGNPVKATVDDSGSADSFFEKVEIKDDMLVVTMNGQEYSLPIVANLIADISEPKGEYENGVWYITWGSAVTTEVTVKGDNYFVTVPAGGWTASVSKPDADGKAILTVKAPDIKTRAVADNSTELVLQVNKGVHWAIDKIKVVAGDAANTPYERYMAGRDLQIGDITINKAKFGEAVHITQNATIDDGSSTQSGVYFIEEGVCLEMFSSWNYGLNYLIVIGNTGNRTAQFKVTKKAGNMTYLKSPVNDDKSGYYIWHNLTCDHTVNAGLYYPDSKNGKTYNIVFDDCEMRFKDSNLISLWNLTDHNTNLDLKIQNNTFVGGNTKELIFGSDCYSPRLGTLTIQNNIFYSGDHTSYKLFAVNESNFNLAWDKITLSHNTFVNVEPGASSAFIIVSKVNEHYTCTNNLFYANIAMDKNRMIFYPLNYEALDGSLEGSIKRNVGYKAGGEKGWGLVWYDKIPVTDYENIITLSGNETPFETFDLTTGTFIPKAEYADCGATLK